MPTTRTPEGEPNHCFLCTRDVVIEPSAAPVADAPCPHCGCLLWFPEPGYGTALYKALNVTEFANRIEEWADRLPAPKLVIDFKDVDFIGSEVLGKLIALHRKAQVRGLAIGLKNIRPMILDVFKITKLDRLFEIDAS